MQTIHHYNLSKRVFEANPSLTNALMHRAAASRCLRAGGTAEYPSGYPAGENFGTATSRTADVVAEWLATADNPADATVRLAISGNKLVALLNAVSVHLHDKFGSRDNESELWQIVEACRDALVAARAAKRDCTNQRIGADVSTPQPRGSRHVY